MAQRIFQGARATLASKGLHEHLVQFAEESKDGNRAFNVIMKRRNMA